MKYISGKALYSSYRHSAICYGKPNAGVLQNTMRIKLLDSILTFHSAYTTVWEMLLLINSQEHNEMHVCMNSVLLVPDVKGSSKLGILPVISEIKPWRGARTPANNVFINTADVIVVQVEPGATNMTAPVSCSLVSQGLLIPRKQNWTSWEMDRFWTIILCQACRTSQEQINPKPAFAAESQVLPREIEKHNFLTAIEISARKMIKSELLLLCLPSSECLAAASKDPIVVQKTFPSVRHTVLYEADKKERGNALNTAIDNMCKKTRDLRRQLRKAIIDHISDSFMDTTVPLLVLTEAAKRDGDIHNTAVANLACSVSTNEEGINIVQTAANHLETLCPQGDSVGTSKAEQLVLMNLVLVKESNLLPSGFCIFFPLSIYLSLGQVINAAVALAAKPKSQVVKNNMEMYKATWENHIRVLTEAVDDITSIDDFLGVSASLEKKTAKD
ncbi:hypothetical protein L345_07798, partial [Ophiophagus hannah]